MTDILVFQLFTQKSDQIHKQSHLLHCISIYFFQKKKAETSFIYIKNNNSMYQNKI
jgi:hypothetical protein